MEKLKLKEVAGNIDLMYQLLETKPKLLIVKNILCDAVLFTRLSNRMLGVLNVFEPKNEVHEFNIIEHCYGISNASDLLKVKDQNLDVALTQIYHDLVCSDTANDCNAEDLATLVLSYWLKEIKKYNSTYKLIA